MALGRPPTIPQSPGAIPVPELAISLAHISTAAFFLKRAFLFSSFMVKQPEAILRECRKKLEAELTCVEPPSKSLLLLHCLVVLWTQSCPPLRSSTRKFGQRDPVSVFPVCSLISSLLPRQPIACKSSVVSN